MAADRMRRGHDLFTLRDWGHLEKAPFGGGDRLHWLCAFLFLEQPSQKAFINFSARWWGPQRGRIKSRVLLLQSCCSPLLLDCSYSESKAELASWLPNAPSFLYTCLALPCRNRTKHRTAPYEPPGSDTDTQLPHTVWITQGVASPGALQAPRAQKGRDGAPACIPWHSHTSLLAGCPPS